MPRTDAARRQYARPAARYATDLTDAEWALLAPHLPAPNRLGRPREVDLRAVLNPVFPGCGLTNSIGPRPAALSVGFRTPAILFRPAALSGEERS